MSSPSPQEGALRKDLTLFGVFAVATGTTLSAGIFLLPGFAYSLAGPAVVLSYAIAALMMIAPMLCKVELATAMPKAGGTYFFLDRSLGPLAGTIGGLGTWLALTLKASFALVGMGAYLSLFFEDSPIRLIAIILAVLFGLLNLLGTKATTRFQNLLVIFLLALLGWFLVQGSFSIEFSRFDGFFQKGAPDILATAGPDHYLVSLSVNSSAANQGVSAAADAADAIVSGFKVSAPAPAAPAPPATPAAPAAAPAPGLPQLLGLQG